MLNPQNAGAVFIIPKLLCIINKAFGKHVYLQSSFTVHPPNKCLNVDTIQAER